MSITSVRFVVFNKKKFLDAFGNRPSPHQRPRVQNPVTGPSPVPRNTPASSMNFPQPVAVYTTHNHIWYNQITDYVLKLEERIADLERLQSGEPIKDSLAENPWISNGE